MICSRRRDLPLPVLASGLALSLILSGCGGDDAGGGVIIVDVPLVAAAILAIGDDQNSAANTFIQDPDPARTGGGRDQSLEHGDELQGGAGDDVLIGGLGVDVLEGGAGDDVLIGGTEDFNPNNRDRGFGGVGNDVFIWAPGDGSDFFDGGPGDHDTVMFGLLGENDGLGGVKFGVEMDQNFDGIALDMVSGLPMVDVAGSPGFCQVIDGASTPTSALELARLDLDHLVQFLIRGIADDFAAGVQTTDNGLRVTLHLRNVEYVVCTARAGGSLEVLDLRTSPPTLGTLDMLPSRVVSMLTPDPGATGIPNGTLAPGVDPAGFSVPVTIMGGDLNSSANAFVQDPDPALTGGGRDMSLQFGDILDGGSADDLLVGRRGIDLLRGHAGHDVLVGGTEDFGGPNRDRAFGGPGDDTFIWAPGDGSDLFAGGTGLDTLVLGILGELDAGMTVFQVQMDMNSDPLFIDPVTGLPQVDVTNSPGFCTVIDSSTSATAGAMLAALDLQQLVQFSIRGIANDFDAGVQTTDNGLRVTIHCRDIEHLVCTSRGGGVIEVWDLRTAPPTPANLVDLPVHVQGMIR